MPRVERSDQAQVDLRSILDFIDRRSSKAAEHLAAEIDLRCETYARFPEMGRAREELAPGLRSFSVGDYILFYRPIDDGIEVLRIIHGRRDLSSMFD